MTWEVNHKLNNSNLDTNELLCNKPYMTKKIIKMTFQLLSKQVSSKRFIILIQGRDIGNKVGLENLLSFSS